jgi:hypothetical protein
MAFCEKAEFQLSDSMLNLDLMQVSNCGNDVKFPIAQNEGDCPVRGLILNVEQVEIQVDFQNICDDNGCYPEPIYAQATRTTYADGECGSYIEDVIN